jgi:hypothetical protein
MPPDPAQRRADVLTKLTILQWQTELLQRQAWRRNGMSDADRRWFETHLAAILRTTRELASLIVEDAAPP